MSNKTMAVHQAYYPLPLTMSFRRTFSGRLVPTSTEGYHVYPQPVVEKQTYAEMPKSLWED